MDINGFKKTKEREEIIRSESDPLIRTMYGDITAQEIKGGNRKASPPDELPIVESINESIKNSEPKAQKETGVRIQEEVERQKRLREKTEKERFKAQKEAEARIKEEAEIRAKEGVEAEKEAEKQRILNEKAEKERIKAQKEANIRAKEEAEKQRILNEKAEKERIKAQKEANIRAKEEAEKQRILNEKAEKERIKAQKKIERQRKIKEIKTVLIKNTPKIIAGLVVIFLIIGTGIFFYWWNYIRVIPVIITHFECQNEQCVEVEGEGESKCQIDENCKPIEIVEPIIPEKLISSAEIEIIELSIEEYESFLNKVESIFTTEQEKDIFKVILIKLIKQTEKEYADFDSFITISGIDIPENIQNVIATSSVNGDNYNLFLHNNGEENRMGLVINMGQSLDLIENLKDWENTIIDSIKPLIFKDGNLEPATEEFQDNIYKEIAMRYINLPISDLSIDYAIINNKLIITTSKDSMYAIIDALTD